MESLHQKQSRFSQMVARLLQHAAELDYEVTLGEAWRTPEQASRNAASGIGIANSLHCERLAIDLNLFKDGQYLQHDLDHEPLGLWWEAQGGSWGGRFGDGNHYSLEHNGIK